MTEKRDESKDVFVVAKFGKPLRVYPSDTQIIDSPDGSEECAYYVPHSQYAALEAENARLKQSLETANATISKVTRILRNADETGINQHMWGAVTDCLEELGDAK